MEELGLKVKEGDRGYPNFYHLLLVLFASVLRSSLESVSRSFRDVGLDVPSADAVLKNIASKTVNTLERLINRVLFRIFSLAWIRGIPAVVSMDLTDILYYGKDGEYVANTKPRNGTHKAFKFLTVSIVSTVGKFVLFVKLVKQGEDIGKLTRRIVQRLKKLVEIKWLVLDKGFYTKSVIYGLEKEGVSFIIAAPRYKSFDKYFKDAKSSFVRHYVAKRFPVWLIRRVDSKGVVYYVSNRKPVNAKNVSAYHYRYKRRWRIEVSFRMIKSFMAFTTSSNPVVRLFFFGFSVVIYNLFIASNFKWLKPEEKAKLGLSTTGRNFTQWLLKTLIVGIIKIAL